MKKYMGNKSKELEQIFSEVSSLAPDATTIFDAFSGTTNVGQYFKKKGYSVISNDINSTSRLLGNVYIEQNKLPKFTKLFSSNCYSIKNLYSLQENEILNTQIEHLIVLNHNTCDDEYMASIVNSNAIKLLTYLSFDACEIDYKDPFYSYELNAENFIWRNFCKKGSNSQYFNLVSQKSILSTIEILKNCAIKSSSLTKAISLLQDVYEPPFHIDNILKAKKLLESVDSTDPSIIKATLKLSVLSKKKNHTGNRMFFSEEHGKRIDTINNLNLLWLKDGLISVSEYHYLQCALVESIALFSNTSATYQAFYKTYRENTKQQFRLVIPQIIPSTMKHYVFCTDTFELVEQIKIPYDVLYLDPPYNWRIYDSNYHLLNLVANFDKIADNIVAFEHGISGAAGENRTLVRNYTNYNRRNTFEDLLFQLILKAKCKYFVISYSDSMSNHNKNSLSSVERITNFLKDPNYFVPQSFAVVEVKSKNFESRKNEKKDKIHELLFVAEKKS